MLVVPAKPTIMKALEQLKATAAHKLLDLPEQHAVDIDVVKTRPRQAGWPGT